MEQIIAQAPIAFALYLWMSAALFPVFSIYPVRAGRRLKRSVSEHEAELRGVQDKHSASLKMAEDEYERKAAKLADAHSKSTSQLVADHKKALDRYSQIVSMEDEMARLESQQKGLREEAEVELQQLRSQGKELLREIEELRSSYKSKRETYDRLKKEIAIFDDRLSFSELGVYEPHFDFGDSESYKTAIKEIRDEQKEMVKGKSAVFGLKEWTVDGSASKGQTMINRSVRLALRAFNNECEAAIANTRWNNIQAMEKRIDRARTAINKLNASHSVIISDSYLQVKLKELRLTHEYRETLKLERDERAETARQEREEKRLLQEAKAAEKEEQQYQALLDKARSEVSPGRS